LTTFSFLNLLANSKGGLESTKANFILSKTLMGMFEGLDICSFLPTFF
jgi:hypothetical protein